MRARSISLLLALFAVGCPAPPSVEPVFPADYASSYTEVRDCRRSPEHDLAYIRVLASEDAREVYQTRTGDFPEGAVVLKEEHADADCTDLTGWAVMRREGGDWRWQEVALSAARAAPLSAFSAACRARTIELMRTNSRCSSALWTSAQAGAQPKTATKMTDSHFNA